MKRAIIIALLLIVATFAFAGKSRVWAGDKAIVGPTLELVRFTFSSLKQEPQPEERS